MFPTGYSKVREVLKVLRLFYGLIWQLFGCLLAYVGPERWASPNWSGGEEIMGWCGSAAVAAPGRKVICLEADGSGMYTVQALWTQARENLDIVTIVFANRIYQILRGEFDNVGAGEPGQRANDMLRLDRPTLDFVALAKGMGVPGRAVTNADKFNKALAEAVAEPGPRLIEVQM